MPGEVPDPGGLRRPLLVAEAAVAALLRWWQSVVDACER